ncbi:hypothetical protein BC828DRAFT_400901 [Blastocladiella britannica]|nr:hypothetical protein BC828DRAFT_400901 [Blastocladiella britannica]
MWNFARRSQSSTIILGNGPGALAYLDAAVVAGALEHRFASPVANRAVLEAFAQSNPGAAIALLEEMIRLSPSMQMVHSRTGPPEHPVLVPQVFSGLMTHCSQHRKLDLALKVAELAKLNGVAVDAAAIGALVGLQRAMGDRDGALDLIYAHPELQPNINLMSYAMDILGELGDRDAAVGLYNAAIEAHTNPAVGLVITRQFLTTAVRALGRLSGFDGAVDAYLHMVRDLDVQPSASVIIHLEDHVDRGTLSSEHVARRMAEVHRVTGTVALAEESVAWEIERHLVHNDVDKAISALLQLRKHDIPTTGSTWSLLLNYMAERRDAAGFDRIMALRPQLAVRWMKSPDDATYAVLIKGYSRTDRRAKAIEVWDDILAHGSIPSAQSQASVLDACGFLGDLAVLQRVAGQIEAAPWGGTDANTWTSAVEAYLRVGRLDLALDVGQRILPLKNVQPDLKFWDTLLTVNSRSLAQSRDPGVHALFAKYGQSSDQIWATITTR